MFKTTKKHFRMFKCECEKWIAIFGLKGWEVVYFHEDDTEDEGRGWASYKVTGRVCSMGLARTWKGICPTKHGVQFVAFHEVCELLLARLMTEAKYRFTSEEVVDEAAHEIIRVLEKVLWEREYNGEI